MTRPGPRDARARVRALLALALLVPLAGCLDAASELTDRGAGRAATAPLDVTVSGPESVSVGDTARFRASAKDVAAGTAFWFWDFGDGVEHEGVDVRTVEHTFTEAGRFTVTLTVVDADGRRGVARLHVGADQAYAFEGSVSRVDALGAPEYAATFPVRAHLATVHVDVTLERPSPAFGVVEPTPPEVVLRVRAPAADGSADGAVVLEERVTIDGSSTRVTRDVAGEAFEHAGDATFEIEAVEGSAHFTVDLVTRYA